MAIRVPYGFQIWNSPMSQRAIWGAPEYYEWQEQIFNYLCDGLHRHVVLSTPNESGKTQLMIPMLGLAVMSAFPGATVYSTAGAEAQIKDQLFEYLKSYAKPYTKGGWVVNQSQLTVTAPVIDGMPASRWIGRVPRDALTAEGFHESWDRDNKGRDRFRPLLMIADEAKSLKDSVIEMMLRLRPTWILMLSTPDTDSGPFYRAMNPEEVLARGVDRRGYKYIESGGDYWGLRMMVNSKACPHLLTEDKIRESDAVRKELGPNHRLVRSMIDGLFTPSEGEMKLYSPTDIKVAVAAMGRTATQKLMEGEAHAGFDVSVTAAGDEKLIYIVKGKVVLPVYKSIEEDTVKVAEWAVKIMRDNGVAPRNCRVDNGGAGKVVVDMMEGVFGYRGIDRYMNNSTSRYSADYKDRIVEDSYGVKQLLHEIEDLVLPSDDRLLKDMKSRKVEKDDKSVIRLQSKKIHRKENNWESPDHLDTLTMALSGRCKHGIGRFIKEKLSKNAEYDEKKTRGKHFAEKKLQDENAKKLGGWARPVKSKSKFGYK